MVLSIVGGLLNPQFLRQLHKIRALVGPTSRRIPVLSRTKSKPSAKLARKPISRTNSIQTPNPQNLVERRKRLQFRGENEVMKTHPKLHGKNVAEKKTGRKVIVPFINEDVFTMSVTDFYEAARRTFDECPDGISAKDTVFLDKLRKASFRHDMIYDIKDVDARLRNLEGRSAECSIPRRLVEHPIIGAQLHDEEAKRARRAEELARENGDWDKLIEAVLDGDKLIIEPSETQEAKWLHYNLTWDSFSSGLSADASFTFDELPWPTFSHELELSDYASFILDPSRGGYQQTPLIERIQEERRNWSSAHVKAKILPYVVEEDQRKVASRVQILQGHLDALVARYVDKPLSSDISTLDHDSLSY